MATRMDDNRMLEDCTECDNQTPHDVRIELLTESTKQQNSEFSREPYRVSTCQMCGREETMRMNNA